MFFAKERRLCLLSHHDLMRAFHRAIRRAGLPVTLTKGYNPRPRVVFPCALQLGIPSEDEVAEIELDEWVPPAEFARRFARACPEGLTIGEVKLMPPKRKGSRAIEAVYAAELGEARIGAAREGVRCFLERDTWKIERTRPDGRALIPADIRPQVIDVWLEDVRLEDLQERGARLVMRLRLGQPGAARPREVLAAVLGRGGDPMFDVPLKKTRTVLTGPS